MNLRPTKQNIQEEEEEAKEFAGSAQEFEGCYHAVYDLEDDMNQKMYTDQTGRFPVQLYSGMKYIMVLYNTTSNAILVEPLRNKTIGEMFATYETLVERLKEGGLEPKMHILDNEILQEYKEAIEEHGMKFQLVPSNNHRRNIAKKAIRVFKDHFISVFVLLTLLSLYVCGARSYTKLHTSSTSYAPQGWILPSPHLRQ